MTAGFEWEQIVAELNRRLKPDSAPVALKFLEREEQLLDIPKIRRPEGHFAPCVAIGQASTLLWTVGITLQNFHAKYCATIHGLYPKDEKFNSGRMFAGVWYRDEEDAMAHHTALTCAPCHYQALAVSPLASGRIAEPDVCVLYLNTAQAFLLLAGLGYPNYRKLAFTFSGESTCSDSWISTLVTGEPKLSIPCFAERKFAGRRESDVCVTMSPNDLCRAIEGCEGLHKNGLRYPIPSYGLTTDMLAGLPQSYLEY